MLSRGRADRLGTQEKLPQVEAWGVRVPCIHYAARKAGTGRREAAGLVIREGFLEEVGLKLGGDKGRRFGSTEKTREVVLEMERCERRMEAKVDLVSSTQMLGCRWRHAFHCPPLPCPRQALLINRCTSLQRLSVAVNLHPQSNAPHSAIGQSCSPSALQDTEPRPGPDPTLPHACALPSPAGGAGPAPAPTALPSHATLQAPPPHLGAPVRSRSL